MSGMNDKYPLALPVGTVLAGQYIVDKVLGQGGFGITYAATDHKTGGKVAVKEFFPDTLATRTQTVVTAFSGERGESYSYGKTCFLQEAETLAKFIGNNNIVRIHSYFEENGTAYFVMDFVEGMSFDQYIKAKGGKVSYEEAKNVLIPIMDALYAVHNKGIVHRDVTPDNIFITNDGVVKLLDFGAARYSLGDKSRSLDVVLKHGFAPKEQYTRRGKQGPFTDIYSLGASFYFALTGKRPPDSVERLDEDDLIPPSSLGISIPQNAEDAILKAMSVQPADRFQTMLAFKNAILSSGESAVSGAAVGTLGNSTVQQRFFSAPAENVANVQRMPSQQMAVPPQQIQQSPQAQQPIRQQYAAFGSAPRSSQSASPKKWLIPVIAGGSALVVGIIVLIIVIAVSANKKPKTPYVPDVPYDPGTVTSQVTPDPVPVEPDPEPVPVNPIPTGKGSVRQYTYYENLYGMTKDEFVSWAEADTDFANARVEKNEDGEYTNYWLVYYTDVQGTVSFSNVEFDWDTLRIYFDSDDKVEEITYQISGDHSSEFDSMIDELKSRIGEPDYETGYEDEWKFVSWYEYESHYYLTIELDCFDGTEEGNSFSVSFAKY